MDKNPISIRMERNCKKRIFFRDDDAAELSENLKQLIDIFTSHHVPIHLSVIPALLTQECGDYLVKKVKESGGLIEIGQHGYIHNDYSLARGRLGKYEFGPKRSYQQQRADITRGRVILRKRFGDGVGVFTPPWHGFDNNTLRALSHEGFEAISAAHRELNGHDFHGLGSIPININFNKRNDDGGWVTEENVEIVKKISRVAGLNVGILLHHEAFNGKDEFRQLAELLRFLKNRKYAEFVHLSKWQEANTAEPGLRPEVVAYFLNYQFVPKPLTITRNSANPVLENFNFDYLVNPGSTDQEKDPTCEEMYSKLKQVTRAQLPKTEEPIGVLLSGGLDSGAILHVLREVTSRKIYTLTGAYFADAPNLAAAELLAKKYDTVHQRLIINPEDFPSIDALYRKGAPQPIGDNGFLPTYLMLNHLREKTRHIFSGDGADCLFCGLRMHYLNYARHNNLIQPASADTRPRSERWDYAHYRFGEVFLNEQELDMAFEGSLNGLQLDEPLAHIADTIKTDDPVKRQIWLDLQFLVGNRVDYVVYAAKAAGVQTHLPYLHKQFVHFATGIPSHYLQDSSLPPKDMLRKAFAGKLPPSIVKRKSEGFTPPFKLWYYKNREFVIRKLAQGKKLGIATNYIKYLAQSYRDSHVYEKGMKIWLLINLVSWYDQHAYRKADLNCATG